MGLKSCFERMTWFLTFVSSLPRHYAKSVQKYGVTSGPYFPVFELNTGKYGPEITSYLDTFHAVAS